MRFALCGTIILTMNIGTSHHARPRLPYTVPRKAPRPAARSACVLPDFTADAGVLCFEDSATSRQVCLLEVPTPCLCALDDLIVVRITLPAEAATLGFEVPGAPSGTSVAGFSEVPGVVSLSGQWYLLEVGTRWNLGDITLRVFSRGGDRVDQRVVVSNRRLLAGGREVGRLVIHVSS
ncbi:hypothetical protein MRX96_035778 [Rhipicephalus microplus]